MTVRYVLGTAGALGCWALCGALHRRLLGLIRSIWRGELEAGR